MSKRVYFVRHGQSCANLAQEQGLPNHTNEHIDSLLSDLGQIQAKSIKSIINNLSLQVIISSPLRRAIHTAIHAADELNISLVLEPRVREVHWYDMQSRPLHPSTLRESIGKLSHSLALDEKSVQVLETEQHEHWQPTEERGMRSGDLHRRKCKAVSEVLDVLMARDEKIICVFTHWGLMSEILKVDPQNCDIYEAIIHKNSNGISEILKSRHIYSVPRIEDDDDIFERSADIDNLQSTHCQHCNCDHSTTDCPRNIANISTDSTINSKLCRVADCTACLPYCTHNCKNCKLTDVDHHADDCPLLKLFSTPPSSARGAGRTKRLASTVTAFTHHRGSREIYVLLCRRGVSGRDCGCLFSQGGSVDRGESPEDAAVRECYEESGLQVHTAELCCYGAGPRFWNYYVMFDMDDGEFPSVAGPVPECRWEVIADDSLSRKFNVPMILDDRQRNTGLAWVKAEEAYQQEIKHAKNGMSHNFAVLKNLKVF